MKKIVMIFAAMAVVLSSCSKNELERISKNESKDIVLNISVSNPGVDDTKALIKTGWVENDEISIWFDTDTCCTPNLVIKYDGSNWKQAGVSTGVPVSGSGYVKAVYKNNVIVASKDDYAISGNTLTFSIANWTFLTELQVVVKGLKSTSASKYTLACDKFTTLAGTGNGYTVAADAIMTSAGTKGAATTGISNTDGVAFVFATADYSSTPTNFKFTLTDNTSSPAVTKVYNPNVIIEAKVSTINAMAIACNKFVVIATDFVDLGLPSGLKWGTYNLGASNPQDYGNYYFWAGTIGYIWDGSKWVTAGTSTELSGGFTNSNTPYYNNSAFSKYTYLDSKTVLESADDAAYKENKSWRIPTMGEFTELAKMCFAEWTTSYNSTGVKGLIVWKAKTGDAGWFKPSAEGKGRKIKDDGSGYEDAIDHTFSNTYSLASDVHIFFPASGVGDGTSFGTNPSLGGYYWTSTYYQDYYFQDMAYGLFFYSNDVWTQGKDDRYRGYSVRPVSN